MSIKGVYSLRHDYRDYRTFKKHFSYGTFDSGDREGAHNHYNWNWYTSQLLINYNKSINNHSFGVLAGAEQVKHTYRYTTTSRKGGGNDELTESLNTLDASSQKNSDGGYETARLSYFGRIQYDYNNKYLLKPICVPMLPHASRKTTVGAISPHSPQDGEFRKKHSSKTMQSG